MFDTHLMVKRLIAAGFSDNQAETVTEVVRDSRQFDLDNLVTKADLAEIRQDFGALRADVRQEIGTFRAEVRQEIGTLRAEVQQDIGTLRAEVQQDIGTLRADVQQDIGSVRTELITLRSDMNVHVARLTAAIADSRTDLLRWMIGLLVAQSGLMFALMRMMQPH